MSGCFNSCGQHHLADIGFYGVSRKSGGRTVPHFRVLLGGQWSENAAAYGLAIGAIPSKRVPDFVDALLKQYLEERASGESFRGYVERIGKQALKELVDRFTAVPPYEMDRSFYSDWRDPREFAIADIGTGECAGEVVSLVDFDLAAAERQYFEAQLQFEAEEFQKADNTAYRGMLQAARGLLRTQFHDVGDDPDSIIAEFKSRFVDTGLFQHKFAGGQFADYLLRRHEDRARRYDRDQVRQLLEETQLFIEAAHACNLRLLEQARAAAKTPGAALTPA
jgi:sulfite reductase (ferredoxin)